MKKTDQRETRVSIRVDEHETVSGIIHFPEDFIPGEGSGIILAHGAGNDMESPFIIAFAEGLSQCGCLTLRFNFPYKEREKRAPDPAHKLEATWLSALKFLKSHSEYHPKKVFAAGKSMGGRIASILAAKGGFPVDGLIFYGYPLHAPGRIGKLRDAHLYSIMTPMLFFAGTRDPLCNLEKLRSVLRKMDSDWKLVVVEGGEHSFKILKSLGKPQHEVYAGMIQETADWIDLI